MIAPDATVLCIYHGNCADGFTAAWVLKNYYDIHLPNLKLEFFAADHIERKVPDVTDKVVYILDYAYDADTMVRIADKARVLVWIDHHKSNEKVRDRLNGHHNASSLFNMEHSGAMLTWNWFHTADRTPPPRLVTLVQDRDLWKFEHAETRWFSAVLFSHPYDFTTWENLSWAVEYSSTEAYRKLFHEGEAILRKQAKDIAELLPVVTRHMRIAGHVVPAANLPYTMSSDAGHELAKGMKFAAVYYDTPQGRCFSLRSAPDGMDVSKIAQVYGGGGHKHAAGFTVPYAVARTFEV